MQEAVIIKFKVNEKEYSSETLITVHNFLESIGITIPKACHVSGKTKGGRCKVCIVEIDDKLSTSCNIMIKENMNILTHSHKALKARVWAIKLLLSHHPALCHSCHKMGNCKLAEAFMQSGEKIEDCFRPTNIRTNIQKISETIELDYSKCIYCGQCDNKSSITYSTVESCPTGALERTGTNE